MIFLYIKLRNSERSLLGMYIYGMIAFEYHESLGNNYYFFVYFELDSYF